MGALGPLVAAALGVGSTGCAHRAPEPRAPVTVVVVAKRVRTMDPLQPVAEALAMREGRLLAVGSAAEVLAAAGPGAIVERFPASTIVPGLVDAHAHLAALGDVLATASLSGATSEAEAVALLARAPTMQGDWLVAARWDQNDWPGSQLPRRESLDAAFPTTPALLHRVDGHAVWVNSEALRRAGVTRDTADPLGGRVVRDETGAPTGVLIDNAVALVAGRLPPPSPQERQRRLARALEACARLGLTGVHDAGLELETFRTLQSFDMMGALPVRVYAMASGQGPEADELLGLGPFRGRRLELRAVKLWLDGALGSRGAALLEPYADEPTQSGLLLLEPADFAARAERFAERGFQVAVHAIGDRANHLALDVLAELEARRPGGRPRIEHAQILRPEDVARFGGGGPVASFQPTHATSDLPWAEARLGKARLEAAYAWRGVLDAGGRVAFGSDFPVEEPNPLWGLHAARTREDRRGQPPGGWSPAQRLTGEEALAGFTTGAAWAAFAESHRGQLAAGFDADFVVLPVDPVGDDPRRLIDAKVELTVVDGVDVYRADPSR